MTELALSMRTLQLNSAGRLSRICSAKVGAIGAALRGGGDDGGG